MTRLYVPPDVRSRGMPAAPVICRTSFGSIIKPPLATPEAIIAMCRGVTSTRPCPTPDHASSLTEATSSG